MFEHQVTLPPAVSGQYTIGVYAMVLMLIQRTDYSLKSWFITMGWRVTSQLFNNSQLS